MRIPGPGDVIRLIGQATAAAEQAIAVVPRAVALVGRAEDLLRRAGELITAGAATEQRVQALVSDIEAIQLRIHGLMDSTEGVVDEARTLTARVTPLLDAYQPALETAAPIVARIARTTSPDEVDAVVALINALPGVVDRLDSDILPVLDTLGTVAPDLRDLLDLSRVMNELLGSIPGLGHVKRRAQEEQAGDDAFTYRADEEPPTAPDRQHSEPAAEAGAHPGHLDGSG